MKPDIHKKTITILGKSNLNMILLTLIAQSCFPDYGAETIMNIVADVYEITNAIAKCWETENIASTPKPYPDYSKYIRDISNMVWEASYGNAQKSKEEQNDFTFGDTEEQKQRINISICRFQTLLNQWFDANKTYPVYTAWEQMRNQIFNICKGE